MKELGVEKDDKVDMIAKFAVKIEDFEARKVDEKVMTVIKDEMQKLSSLERNSPEFNVTRSYLDWLTSVPWKVLTEDRSVYSTFFICACYYTEGLEETDTNCGKCSL